MTPISKTEKEKLFKQVESGNPELDYWEQDSILVSAFEKIGIVKNGEVILKKFISKSDSTAIYIDSSGNKLQLKFYFNEITKNTNFKLQNSNDTIDVDTGASPVQKLDYAFIEIIPGGNKELVFLDDWHISNNDRFHFKVYEIITHK